MTATETPPSPLAPFRCLGCNRILGWTDGQRLSIEGVPLPSAAVRVALRCQCRRVRAWHPGGNQDEPQ